jgi:intein-encoded DNA endonuclease-like protein
VAAPQRTGTGARSSRRRRTVPLALRIDLYGGAKALRRQGLTYSEIAEALRKQHRAAPSKGQLSEWLRGIHGPFGSANRFLGKPIPELAYVIGVKLGDGSLNRKGYNRRIRLQSVDLDFVLEFDRCLSQVLGTLRGFFDSEGCLDKGGHLTCSNSDFALLRFVQHLLSFFKIETTEPRLHTRAGTKISNRGRAYIRRSDVYLIYIRTRSLVSFNLSVGFTIQRK